MSTFDTIFTMFTGLACILSSLFLLLGGASVSLCFVMGVCGLVLFYAPMIATTLER